MGLFHACTMNVVDCMNSSTDCGTACMKNVAPWTGPIMQQSLLRTTRYSGGHCGNVRHSKYFPHDIGIAVMSCKVSGLLAAAATTCGNWRRGCSGEAARPGRCCSTSASGAWQRSRRSPPTYAKPASLINPRMQLLLQKLQRLNWMSAWMYIWIDGGIR